MPGIAETIRQGLFQEEFEKIRNDKKENERRDANSALNASRFERQGEQANIENARQDKRDEFRRTNRTEDLAHRSSQDELAAQAQSATEAFRTAGQQRDAARDAATASERATAGEHRGQVLDNQGKIIDARGEEREAASQQRKFTSILTNLQRNIDDARGDDAAQAQARQDMQDFIGDPEGYIERAGALGGQGAPPEEEPGLFGKGLKGLLKHGSDLAGGV